MHSQKLKYQELLEQFPDCPGSEFEEVEKEVYRWVHQPLIDLDFLPINIISEPPPRLLDDNDKMSAIQREKIKGYKYLSVNKIKLAVKNRITANYIDFCLLLKNKLK